MCQQSQIKRIVIADQDIEVRQALRLVCEAALGLTVVAEASETHKLHSLLKATDPDIILLEWNLPDVSPQNLMKQLHDDESLKIVIIGSHLEMRTEALEAGADGFISKGDPPDELLQLLRTFIES